MFSNEMKWKPNNVYSFPHLGGSIEEWNGDIPSPEKFLWLTKNELEYKM